MSDVFTLVRARFRQVAKQRWALAGITLTVALLLTMSAVVASGLEYYARNIRSSSALNLIEVSSVAPNAKRALDTSALSDIEKVDGVEAVIAWQQVDVAVSNPTDWPNANSNPGALWAGPYIPGLVARVVTGNVPAGGLSPGQIALPDKVPGGTLQHLVGKRVEFEYTRITGPGQGEPRRIMLDVVATIDNSVPDFAGPTPSYMAPSQVSQLIKDSGGSTASGPTTAFVKVKDPGAVQRVQSTLAEAGFAVSSLANQVPSLGGLFDLLSSAQSIAVVLTIFMALILGGMLGASWTGSRTREIGLLKAVGWSSRRVGFAIVFEYLLVGVLAALMGILLGVLTSLIATALVAQANVSILPVVAWTVPPLSMQALVLGFVPPCVCLGGLASAWRAARVEPDSALRDL